MKRVLTSNFKGFIEGLIVEKRTLGRKYIGSANVLYRFDAFCAEGYPGETVLTQEIAMNWTLLMPGEQMSGLHNRATAIRQLAKYIWRHGIEAYILPDGFTGKVSRHTPHIYSMQELSVLFHVMDHLKPCDQYPFHHFVVPVFYRLIYTCGLRPGEALTIKASDVNLKTGEILIREAKGNKDRIVVLSTDMLVLCRRYYTEMRMHYPRAEVFFPNYLGKAYSVPWMEKTFAKMLIKAGLETSGPNQTRPRLYDLRHTFATECLFRFASEGKDLSVWLVYLSSYMGHLDYDSTAYYMHLTPAYSPAKRVGSDVFNEIVPEVRHEVY